MSEATYRAGEHYLERVRRKLINPRPHLMALVITAIVLAARYLVSGHHGTLYAPHRRAAEDVLGERLARGEIDDDEYRQRMATLRERR